MTAETTPRASQRDELPMIRFKLRCDCGDTGTGTVSPPAAYAQIKAAFQTVHSGDGCRVVDLTEETRR